MKLQDMSNISFELRLNLMPEHTSTYRHAAKVLHFNDTTTRIILQQPDPITNAELYEQIEIVRSKISEHLLGDKQTYHNFFNNILVSRKLFSTLSHCKKGKK